MSKQEESPAGQVFVISGPTAVGKGTVVKELLARYPRLCVSVSATTRKPRPGEIAGVDYYFVSEPEFDQLVKSNGLLEWATVHGSSRYGTLRKPVEEAIQAGRIVILEIDLQGARQVRKSMPEAKQIFLKPPSWEELIRRLTGRGTESPSEQQVRLRTAQTELLAESEFDAVVVNDQLEACVQTLVEILGL